MFPSLSPATAEYPTSVIAGFTCNASRSTGSNGLVLVSARKTSVSAFFSGDKGWFCARAGMETRATIIAVIDKRRRRIGSLPYDKEKGEVPQPMDYSPECETTGGAFPSQERCAFTNTLVA